MSGSKNLNSSTGGVYPPARQDHSCTFDSANGLFYSYGGFGLLSSGAGPGLLDDVWRYDTSLGSWTLLKGGNLASNTVSGTFRVSSTLTTPGARRHSSLDFDSTQNALIAFGGLSSYSHAEMWIFFLGNSTWMWMDGTLGDNVYSTISVPGGRSKHMTWFDPVEREFWLVGGEGFPESPASFGLLCDYWRFQFSYNGWTGKYGTRVSNAGGSPGQAPGVYGLGPYGGCRRGATSAVDTGNQTFVTFGGFGYLTTGGPGQLKDVWSYSMYSDSGAFIGGSNTSLGVSGLYNTLRVRQPSNSIGSRSYASSFMDGSTMYIFGGTADNAGTDRFNDLWRLDSASGSPLQPPPPVAPPVLPPTAAAPEAASPSPAAGPAPSVGSSPPTASPMSPPASNPCALVRPEGAQCVNGTWIVPTTVVNTSLTVTSPIIIPGNFTVGSPTATVTITVPQTGTTTVPLQIGGCATFAGNLSVLVPANTVLSTTGENRFTLATFEGGYCGGAGPQRFASVTPDFGCRTAAQSSVEYNAKSLVVIFSGVDDSKCNSQTTSGLSTGGIVGIVVAIVVILIVGVILLVLFIMRKRVVPSLKANEEMKERKNSGYSA